MFKALSHLKKIRKRQKNLRFFMLFDNSVYGGNPAMERFKERYHAIENSIYILIIESEMELNE